MSKGRHNIAVREFSSHPGLVTLLLDKPNENEFCAASGITFLGLGFVKATLKGGLLNLRFDSPER
jgi:hypothetical protein